MKNKILTELRNIPREERDKGNKLMIGYMKLNTNGKEWRWNKEQDKLSRESESKL